MSLFDITQSTGNNDGGHAIVASLITLADFDATSYPGLVAAPATNADLVTLEAGDMTAIVGKKWTKLQAMIEKIGASLSSEGSAGSKNLVSMPKIRLENLTAEELGFVKSLKSVPLLIVLKDLAGTQWLYGTPDLPCYLEEVNGDWGTAAADDKFIEFTLRHIAEPHVYPGSISYAVVV